MAKAEAETFDAAELSRLGIVLVDGRMANGERHDGLLCDKAFYERVKAFERGQRIRARHGELVPVETTGYGGAWLMKTRDPLEWMVEPDYFSTGNDMLAPGDWIFVTASCASPGMEPACFFVLGSDAARTPRGDVMPRTVTVVQVMGRRARPIRPVEDKAA